MKKLEQAFQKIDKYGQVVIKKLIKRPTLSDIQGIGK